MEKDTATWRNRIVTLFEAGKRFTEELLRENERLRLVNDALRAEVENSASAHSSDLDSMRARAEQTERECAVLREELRILRQRQSAIETENRDFAARHMEVERQNSSLLNIYVANQRLTSTLEFDELADVLADIVVNLIGSEHFELVIANLDADRQVRIRAMGPMTNAPVRSLDPAVRRAVERGEPAIRHDEGERDSQRPFAYLPLRATDGPVAVIIIHELLPHKAGLADVDIDMFHFLTEQAGTVLRAAHWYTAARDANADQAWPRFVDQRALLHSVQG